MYAPIIGMILALVAALAIYNAFVGDRRPTCVVATEYDADYCAQLYEDSNEDRVPW